MARDLEHPGHQEDEGLTTTLEKTLGVIREFMAREGMPPTVQELATMLGISGPSAHAQILRLEKLNYIRRVKGKNRSIELIRGVQRIAHQVRLPIIGMVAAGSPILAVENIIGEISVSSSDVRGNCFALEVVGDSMIDANINEGDYLIVRQQPVAENGDIVVALLDDEATVKRFFMFDDHIELRPANPKYKPIRVGPQHIIYIIGKVVAVSAKASTNLF